MSSNETEIRTILAKAFQVELDGYTFYSMAADKSTKPAVQELFAKLARDEAEHQAYLKAIMKRYEEHGAGSFSLHSKDPGLAEFSSAIFTDAFCTQARGEQFELGVVSIGAQLEERAVAFFTASAAAAAEPQVKGFYRFLADWESLHLRVLKGLYDRLRVDFDPAKP
jgi:rubrerythrin